MTRALQAIVFDFDGVIADSEGLHLRAFQDTLAPLGIPLSREEYFERYLGCDDAGLVEILARDRGLTVPPDRQQALVAAKAARYDELASAGDVLFEGAEAFIRQAADRVPVAVASGALTREVMSVLGAAGLTEVVPVVIGADRTTRQKPAPEPYLTAVAGLEALTGRSFDRNAIVAIEDSRWGLASARAAGLRVVAVTTSYGPEELAAEAELVVAGLHALTLERLDWLVAGPPAESPGAPRPAETPPA